MTPTRGFDERSVLTTRVIVWWSLGLLVLAVGSITALWLVLGGGGRDPAVRLDIIRTALSIVVGGGGAAGLLLTARRQRTTELDLAQKGHDAVEARVTELYGKAAEQLGNDKAPVRLAGIFALERLAQSHPQHRQTIVDLLCAYLRMPVQPADRTPEAQQEREVRESAQQVLTRHLRIDDEEAFWADVRLNLAGATLSTFTFSRCQVRSATFSGTVFVGPAVFRGSAFETQGDFRGVRFTGLADFRRVAFGAEGANFRGARFEGEVDFGTQTEAALTGALATDCDQRRKWPAGWECRPDPEVPGWARLSRCRRDPVPA